MSPAFDSVPISGVEGIRESGRIISDVISSAVPATLLSETRLGNIVIAPLPDVISPKYVVK